MHPESQQCISTRKHVKNYIEELIKYVYFKGKVSIFLDGFDTLTQCCKKVLPHLPEFYFIYLFFAD